MLAVWGGLMWLVWIYLFHEKPIATFGLFDIFWLSVALIGFPLAYVGQYAGLRYRLSRTRWRGIRCALAGSAWGYGAMASFLVFVNAFTAQLLTPVVSVNLARPRISNVRLGTLPFIFAGSSGDIYGRYLGFYFLNIIAWVVALAITFSAIGGAIGGLGITSDEVLKLFSQFSLRTVLIVAAVALGAYVVFGLLILPLRCCARRGLSLPLPGLRTAGAGEGAVRHGDLDPPDVGLPGAELPDRRADPGARLAVGPAPHLEADRRRAGEARRRA